MKIKAEKSFSGVRTVSGVFMPSPAHAGSMDKLPAGMYGIHVTQDGQLYFKPQTLTSDDILDLPSAAFQQVVGEIEQFLKPETEVAFKKLGYVYKRSALLHGLPGTGKSCIVNRIAKKVVDAGNVVLFNPDINLLQLAYSALEDLQPESSVLVILEEMDGLVAHGHESKLLTLLDGQVQKDRIVYLATTNYLDRIPKRLYRPGRMSSVIEVDFPGSEARAYYLAHKLGADHVDIAMLTEATANFSIDEVKEVVQSVYLLGNSLKSTIKRIQDLKGIPDVYESDEEPETDSGTVWNRIFTTATAGKGDYTITMPSSGWSVNSGNK